MAQEVATWTLRGRGEYHAPELDGPYLPHNVMLAVQEVPPPESRRDAKQLQLWGAETEA